MLKIADLHTHSTASDGQYTPAQLVQRAKNRGLEVLALTDHDVLDGLEEAVQTGHELGLQIVRGVELGAKEYRNLHFLGYGFAPDAPALQNLCAWMKEGRNQRKYRIIDFLREKGLELTLEEVEEIAGGDIIARPHFAQAMVRRGYVANNREAFDRYLDTSEYARIERQKPDARTCVETIRRAGGKVSLAHPYQIHLPDDELEKLVCSFADFGLDAIECYYPRHTPEQEAFYLRLAKKYQLHVTGGSDFHGERVKPDIELSALPFELDWLMDGQPDT